MVIWTLSTWLRFQNDSGIAFSKRKNTMHWSFSQIMIDAEDVLLVKSAEQNLVKRLRRRKVVTEGLLNHDAGAAGAVGFGQLFHDQSEQCRRNGEVMCRSLRRT